MSYWLTVKNMKLKSWSKSDEINWIFSPFHGGENWKHDCDL